MLIIKPVASSAQMDTVYEDIPEIVTADLTNIMGWIKAKVAIIKTPYCYRDSYGRSAGVVRSVCARDQLAGYRWTKKIFVSR